LAQRQDLAPHMTIAANQEPGATRWRGAAGRALAWWLGELRGAYLDAARWFDRGRRFPLTIEAGERYWTLRQQQAVIGQIDRAESTPAERHRELVDLIPPARRRRAIIVDIPPERILSKRGSLPAAARGELDRILQFEIARHFPFPAERAFFCYRLLGRGGRSAAIEVELIAVPRDIVSDISDELAAAGLRPAGIAVSGGGRDERLFLPDASLGTDRPAPIAVRRRWLLAVAALAVVALVSWPVAQRVRLAQIDGELTALKPQAQALLAARERQKGEAERLAALFKLRAERPPLIGVLDRLSQAVPDGTWLISLSLAGRELVIDGLSPSAATIALALERSKAFTGIEFRSSITRDPATGLEHFQLGAVLADKKP
jgi:general secretion pathway protein L